MACALALALCISYHFSGNVSKNSVNVHNSAVPVAVLK
jgi:hypothetical protein